MPKNATVQLEIPRFTLDDLELAAPEWMDLVPDMHITLRYGVADSAFAVETFEYIIRNSDPPTVTLGPLAQFTNLGTEGHDGVPVVSLVTIGADSLKRLHDSLLDISSRQQDFPYTPHLTLCYAEPEDIDDETMGSVTPIRFTATHATFIKRNGTRITVPFGVNLPAMFGSKGADPRTTSGQRG